MKPFLLLLLAALTLHAADRPPNVVIIFCDDLGYADIGPFGQKSFATPNLDRMAAEGRCFTNFHVSSAVCSASRSAILTGCYHSRVGIHGALLPMYDGEKVILPAMTHEDQNTMTTRYTERAVAFIEKNKDRPFFFYLAHNMPHVPLHVSAKFAGKSGAGLFGDVIQEIDWSVGEVLAALKRAGVDEHTLVIFTSDNGPWLSYGDHAGSAGPLREGKGTSWDGGTRVPCVMRWPGKIPAGTKTDTIAMTIDILPTVAALTGAKLPERKIDGLDVWPLLSGAPDAKNPHRAYATWYANNELQSVTDGRWKLIFPHTYRSAVGIPRATGGIPSNYRPTKLEQAELFDTVGDIGETTDRAADHPEIVASLTKFANEMRSELGDSLTRTKGSANREPARVQKK